MNTHGVFFPSAADSLLVVCSQPKRGALRRQACIDQHQDPWVRHCNPSPEELPKAQPCPGGSPRPEKICRKPPIMAESENLPTLNDAVEPAEPLSDVTPSEFPSAAKTGPPVAPKPPWFRQSLRRILDERERRKPGRAAEQRPPVGFSRSFGGRSASSAANLSIKQKIHSFETFSTPAGSEMGDNRKPASVSTSCPPGETESRGHSGSIINGKDEVPEEIQADPSASVSTMNSSTTEGRPQEQPGSPLEPRDPEGADVDSGSNDAASAPVLHERSTSPPEEECETGGPAVFPPATGLRLSKGGETGPQVDMEMDEALTVNQPQKDLDGENLEKLLTLSNQVISH